MKLTETRASPCRWTACIYLLLAVALVGLPSHIAAGAAGSSAGAVTTPGSLPRLFTPLAHGALFAATTPQHGDDVWRTDGSAAGTLALDLCPGPWSSRPHFLAGGDGAAFLLTWGDDASLDLWRSDGSAAGSSVLADVAPVASGVQLSAFSAWLPQPGRLLFPLRQGDGDWVLWASDGSAAGSGAVATLASAGQGQPVSFHAGEAAAYLLFGGGEDGDHVLWRSDGSVAGTSLVARFGDPELAASELEGSGDGVVLTTLDAACRVELRGAAAGGLAPLPLAHFEGEVPVDCSPDDAQAPDCSRCVFSAPPPLAAPGAGGGVYFTGYDAAHGLEMWRTDGTSAGTYRLTDLAAPYPFGVGFPGSGDLAALGDGVFFIADEPGEGPGLWRSDAASADTAVRLFDPCAGQCGDVFELATAGGRLFFWADDGSGPAPWISDGSAAGTRPLEVVGGSAPRPLSPSFAAGDGFYYVGETAGDGRELWRSDGSEGTARRLTTLPVADPFPLFRPAALGDGSILFAADDGVHGAEPWISDGTADGTHLVFDVYGALEVDPPSAPRSLSAVPDGATGVILEWSAGDGEPGIFVLEVRSPALAEGGWAEIARLDVDRRAYGVGDLAPGTPYTFRLRAENAAGTSGYSNLAPVTTRRSGDSDGPCAAAADTLCLLDRFGARVHWRNQHAGPQDPPTGSGTAVPASGSDRSGYFWFFRPDNVELVVKELDGRSLNGFFWTFYGALSDVEYWITVTDAEGGGSRTYYNPPGEICGTGDTRSLPGLPGGASAAAATLPALPASVLPASSRSLPGHRRGFVFDAVRQRDVSPFQSPQPCVEDTQTLCLLDGRFRVRVAWEDQHNGGSGVGGAVPFADRTGFFWFFHPANVELAIKVLDGTPVNGKIWVFYGALSDVGYTIEVFDTGNGQVRRQYVNAPGNICGEADTRAF